MVDFISLAIEGYDIIIGVNWLIRYHVRLDCRMKVVEFCIPNAATLRLTIRGTLVSSALILEIWVRKLLNKGAQRYLVFL